MVQPSVAPHFSFLRHLFLNDPAGAADWGELTVQYEFLSRKRHFSSAFRHTVWLGGSLCISFYSTYVPV